MLVRVPLKISVSEVVNSLKCVSSRRFGQAGLRKPYGKKALWIPSHFTGSVGGASIEVLKEYI